MIVKEIIFEIINVIKVTIKLLPLIIIYHIYINVN